MKKLKILEPKLLIFFIFVSCEMDLINFDEPAGNKNNNDNSNDNSNNANANQESRNKEVGNELQLDLLMMDEPQVIDNSIIQQQMPSNDQREEVEDIAFEDVSIKQSNMDLNIPGDQDQDDSLNDADDEEGNLENEEFGAISDAAFPASDQTRVENNSTAAQFADNEFSDLVSSVPPNHNQELLSIDNKSFSSPYIYASNVNMLNAGLGADVSSLPNIMTRADLFVHISSTDKISEALQRHNPSSTGQRRLLLYSEVPQSIQGLELLCVRSHQNFTEILSYLI